MLQQDKGVCEGCLEAYPTENLTWVLRHRDIKQLICITCKVNNDEYEKKQLEKDKLSILIALNDDEIWN